MEKEATLLESGIENEDLCSFYEDELTELYSSCGSDTYRDGQRKLTDCKAVFGA